FFRLHYSLNNAVVSIVGDLKVAEAKKILEKYFEHLPVRPLEESAITAEPEQTGERRIQVVCDAEPGMVMGYHKPTVPDFTDYVFDVIDSLLSSGRTSRLYKHLVLDKKNAVSVETFNGFPGTRYPNLFVIKVLPSKSSTYDDVEKSVYTQIEALKHGAIAQEELDKVKKQLKTDFIHKLQSNAELAGVLSYYATVCNDWRYLEKHLETIEKITAVDVQSVARQYLVDKNKTIAYLVKENK
ncbi:MAG: insulinase family protein, partial [Pseudomonadota bacterium]